MKNILLDTNFCMIPFQFKVDIFAEIDRIVDSKYVICVLDKSIDELKKLVDSGKGKNANNAKMALQLLKKKRVKVLKTKSKDYVDDLIVDLVDDKWVVCTQDIGLRKRLKLDSIKVIMMRQKKFLVFA